VGVSRFKAIAHRPESALIGAATPS
jgi:hypothetical protein